ncbi:aminopeptidase P family protein [Candidatus Acetothermia bacterium]|nr:MAG: aminopeptidase P family protein [Candidatus Acetothermia bacterium]
MQEGTKRKEERVPIRLSKDEFVRRRGRLAKELAEADLDALCLFSPTQVFYLTCFSFIATERPIGLIYVPDADRATLFVPLLEREHAEEAYVEDVQTYPEYPDETHPMELFSRLLRDLKPGAKRVGVDADGYPGGYGYRGPALSELVDCEIVPAKGLIEGMMRIKSEEEIALIRESCRWGGLAHRLLQGYTEPGLNETEISIRASHEASARMIEALGPEYRPVRGGAFPAHAGFRGQIGARSAVPHAMTANAVLKEGDVLVTGAAAEVGGYLSELERTMILGGPTDEQARLFDLMVGAQDLAFSEIRPGRRCSDVDRAVRRYYEENGIVEYWRHHTGHSIGYGMHEAPFLDVGDETVIEPGMVLTVEPGVYVPGFAGFRHSDTILVTDDGIELLTDYPRDLEGLIIEA